MDEDIDTSKELVVYQSKVYLVAIIILDLLSALVFLIAPIIGSGGMDKLINSLSNLLISFVIFIVLLVIFLLTFRQFFIKSPLLRVDNKGFFTRKTGDVSWKDIEKISMFAAGAGSSIIVLDFKNGKKIKINPVNMRLPSEGAFTVDRGFEVFRVLNDYKKSSGL